MKRYIVCVIDPDGDTLSLIVPFEETSTVGELCAETKTRATRNGVHLGTGEVQMRLFSHSGPHLDPQDKLQDVVYSDNDNKIYIICPRTTPRTTSNPQQSLFGKPGPQRTPSEGTGLKEGDFAVRLITPQLARKHTTHSSISLLRGVYSIATSTLEDIRRPILVELALSGNSGAQAIVDLYIQDILIETTNYDTPLSKLGLEECLIDGVLNVYAVTRYRPAPIFGGASRTQQLPQGLADLRRLSQTDRGCASFLASLKVFQSRIKSTKMDEEAQENILQVVYHLTRFFPLLKVIRTMMSGAKMKDYQVSMVVFCFLELLKEMMIIPGGSGHIGSDRKRIFEGSRLLFGHILESAKQVKFDNANKAKLMAAYKTIDFTDAVTGDLVINPIQTELGILDRTTLATRQNMQNCTSEPLSHQVARVFRLSNGQYEEYSYFKYDEAVSATREAAGIDHRMITDLPYLSAICGKTDFAVTLPMDLHKAEAFCLTMDEDGHLSVYLGRPECAGPGEDYQILLPLTNEEKNIDVARVTQALEPILEARKRDGTLVFEAPGAAGGQKETEPSELIMFVVDCSQSMGESSKFKVDKKEEDIELENPALALGCDSILNNWSLVLAEFSEARTLDFLRSHESFEDMIAIVRSRPNHNDVATAREILSLLEAETESQMQCEHHELLNAKETESRYQYNYKEILAKRQIQNLALVLKGIDKFRTSLVRCIISKAYERPSADLASWMWTPGESLPRSTAEALDQSVEIVSFDPMPSEIICPITKEIFGDPVKASDGIIYERAAIRRWFESSSTSPTTALDVPNVRLRHHKPTQDKATDWIEAKDLLSAITGRGESPARKKIKLERSDLPMEIVVNFKSSTGSSFLRMIPGTLSVTDLYKVAFRGQKGINSNFALFLDGQHLAPCDASVSDVGVKQSCTLHIGNSIEANCVSNGGTSKGKAPTHRLFKIYSRSDSFQFGFWCPNSMVPSGLSLVFKFWRFKAEKRRFNAYLAPKVTFWSGCRSVGDGHMRGFPYNSWERFERGPRMRATGCLWANEGIYDDNHDGIGGGGLAVFKLGMYDYSEPLNQFRKKSQKEPSFTRLDVSKEIFSSFINRTLAYKYANKCGLLPISSKPKVTQDITTVLENFRDMVMRMTHEGDTALWDALKLAVDKLNEEGAAFPKAKKRVVCLSDGCDTSSSVKAKEVLRSARESGVVIDSFCIGEEDHSELMWVSHNTGGYKFKPASLEDAMAVGEMEPVLSLLEREIVVPQDIGSKWSVSKTPCTRDSYPKRKGHPNDNDSFTKIDAVTEVSPITAAQSGSGNAVVTRSTIRTTRILSEIRRIAKHQHPYYDVYVSDENIGFWKIIMQGPSDSAYSTGCFVFSLDMGGQYPLFPPEARFNTSILHPNINKHGRICHSIFDRNWTTDTTNVELLNTVFGLLSVPEESDPINTVITLNYRWDAVAFNDEVKAHIEKHASKNRSALRAEIEHA